MSTDDIDDRDALLTGVLAQPLKPGEDPRSKLPDLYKAMGVKSAEELVLRWGRTGKVPKIPCLKPEVTRRRKRRKRGRPKTLSLALEDMKVDGPDFVTEDVEKELCRRMEANQAENGGNLEEAASRVIEQFFPPGPIAGKERSEFAGYLAGLYTHLDVDRDGDSKPNYAVQLISKVFRDVLFIDGRDSRIHIVNMSAKEVVGPDQATTNYEFEVRLRRKRSKEGGTSGG